MNIRKYVVGVAAMFAACSLAYGAQVINDSLTVTGPLVQSQGTATFGAGVNQVVVTGAATGVAPTIGCGGTGADANCALNFAARGTSPVTLGTLCTVTGATPQTCNGQRGVVTTGTLVTAAATSASYVINDNQVAATSVITCSVNAYSGTISTNGNPIMENCVPGAGTITVSIRNVNASNALNGTVGLGFTVN